MSHGYPVRVGIGFDDQCDICSAKSGLGVCFKLGGPVICEDCLEKGVRALLERPTTSLLFSAMARTTTWDAIKRIEAVAHVSITWRCHVCGEERPDEQISVARHDRSAEHGLPPGCYTENVRYCNDRESCMQAARDGKVTFLRRVKHDSPEAEGKKEKS